MTEKTYSEVVETARNYYNSKDAQNFYSMIWGGEDLHLGIYDSLEDDIFFASRRTIDEMSNYPEQINKNTKVIDLGGGFSGSARHLVKKFGCHVTVINLSEVENEYGCKLNKQQGLDDKIDVIDGSFEDIPFKDNTFDIVWSQDAILHSGEREQTIKEAARVLKPGGDMVFTDPMQTYNCNKEVLQPIYERIQLSSLGSPEFYKSKALEYGLNFIDFKEMPEQLSNHYAKVLRETEENMDKIKDHVSDQYIQNMKTGLQNWVNGGKEGNLTWGIFHFKK
ncbi:MAG: methyltransferase domain-containing protein [Bacteroidales bacterium]|nr:methyltransferase domain-containing protein [Bacteroidales bacterium]